MDQLVKALIKCKQLESLELNSNGIGKRGCTSLAKLLTHQETNLEVLDLPDNSIDDEAAAILVGSLARNATLKRLGLGGNRGISTDTETPL